VPKCRRAISFNSEVLSVFLFHFKPIFDLCFKKIVKVAPVSGGKCASKIWSFSSACKNLGAQHPLWDRNMVFRKMRLRVGQNERL